MAYIFAQIKSFWSKEVLIIKIWFVGLYAVHNLIRDLIHDIKLQALTISQGHFQKQSPQYFRDEFANASD